MKPVSIWLPIKPNLKKLINDLGIKLEHDVDKLKDDNGVIYFFQKENEQMFLIIECIFFWREKIPVEIDFNKYKSDYYERKIN